MFYRYVPQSCDFESQELKDETPGVAHANKTMSNQERLQNLDCTTKDHFTSTDSDRHLPFTIPSTISSQRENKKSLVSHPEVTAIVVLSNFDMYSKKRRLQLNPREREPLNEHNKSIHASTFPLKNVEAIRNEVRGQQQHHEYYKDEDKDEILRKFDTFMEPIGSNTKRSVEYSPSEKSWLASFEKAKNMFHGDHNFSIEEEKKIKNWLQNQCKTKKKRPEYMNEKLFSIGEIAYSNSIMLDKWKENKTHLACKRWKKALYRNREKLDDDIKNLLIDNEVFQMEDLLKKKENSTKKPKLTKSKGKKCRLRYSIPST